MQKKLIALAVAGVLAAPLAAQAEVEIYGQARMSVDFSNNDDTTVGQDDAAMSVSSNKSRLGFKGSEDLGGGLKGLWQIEQGVDFDTGSFGSENRDTFLGLGGNFGTVLAGKLSTPYRTSTERLDVFMDTKADYNAIIGSVGGAGLTGDTNIGNLRVNNALAYVTPDMNGFRGTLAYVTNYNDLLGGSGDNLPRSEDDGEMDAFSLSATYDNGPLFVAAAYEVLNGLTAVPGGFDDTAAFKVGGSWNFGQGSTVGAVWESIDLGGTDNDRTAFYLSGAHKMDAITLKAAYAMADEMGNQVDSGATQLSLGASYDLSKTTEAYVLYTQVSNDRFADYGLESIEGFGDSDVSSFSLGINHKFSSK